MASELNKNPNIHLEKYGYKKFSDLITAIYLFDIKKQSNSVYVKLKNQQPTNLIADTPKIQETHKTLTLANIAQTPLILTGDINIYIHTPPKIDAVLWRLGNDKKVRHDGDMIFYGQPQSDDGMIELDGNTDYHRFICRLKQTTDIRQMVFTISHEDDNITHPHPAKVVIEQAGRQLFVDEFALTQEMARSAILFSLVQVETGWQFVPRNQFIRHDLRQLCTVFGVAVDD